MLELTLSAATGALNYVLRKESVITQPSGTGEASTVVEWNPEGPSILTELWMLTLLPHKTKLHFEKHHVTHDIPDKSFFPQMITRTWSGDSRADLKKLVEATKIALNICPPVVVRGNEPVPSINKIYLGAREGLLKLATTYGYTINLEEFRRLEVQDSMLLGPKVKKDKTDFDRKPRKAITTCINLIDRALCEGVKETELQDLSRRVRENWKPENFNAIVLYMHDAKKKVDDNLSSKECPCQNEIQILQGMLNAKVDDYIRFTRECGSHKFTRSISAPPPAAAKVKSQPVSVVKTPSQSMPPPTPPKTKPQPIPAPAETSKETQSAPSGAFANPHSQNSHPIATVKSNSPLVPPVTQVKSNQVSSPETEDLTDDDSVQPASAAASKGAQRLTASLINQGDDD